MTSPPPEAPGLSFTDHMELEEDIGTKGTPAPSRDPEEIPEAPPMLDVHPAHRAASSWREFFIHIATIVLGLLIAVGIEQTVEYIHHRREVAQTREALRKERGANAARFAVETLENNRVIPIFQEDLAVFAFLRGHPGAPPDAWPGQLGGQVITIAYADSAWRTAQQSNVVAFMPAAEIQQTDRIYRFQQILNDLEAAKFDAMNELRKTFAFEQDASHLTAAQLDAAIDRTVNILIICAKIANRQSAFSVSFPEFTPAAQVTYSQLLHWPTAQDRKPGHTEAFQDVSQKLRDINRTEAAEEPSNAGTSASEK
jgi:hypothetical protein